MNPINNIKCAKDSDPSKQKFSTNKKSQKIKEGWILDLETTKENDTVFDITFDGLDCKCKEKGDQKEKENQTSSISAHKNRRRKRDFKCAYCSSVISYLCANKQQFLSNVFESNTIIFCNSFFS